jgi:hypothetical protein
VIKMELYDLLIGVTSIVTGFVRNPHMLGIMFIIGAISALIGGVVTKSGKVGVFVGVCSMLGYALL